jgi:hypothetical protein
MPLLTIFLVLVLLLMASLCCAAYYKCTELLKARTRAWKPGPGGRRT